MYSRPTFVTKLDNHDDLLLSYLNTDDTDTTITTDLSTTATSSPSNNDDAPFTPISTSHLLSPYPFPFTINSLATQFMDTIGGGLTSTGISPGFLSHNESNLPPPPAFMADPPPTSYTNTSSISPTLSMATASSSSSSLSSDLDEPKRKRERKNQNGSKRRGRSPTTSTLLACKPILPARVTIGNKQRPSTIINHERMDTLDHQMAFNTNITVQQQQQQRNDPPPSPIDANTKRQERLIKNRAAALLSRKRKREHLQALEDEQEWLTKENEGLKSKAMALEIKLQQLEKEHQQQEEKILLLEKQQQQQQISCESNDTNNNDMHPIFYTIPPSLESLSTVTNVLMILLVSFVLLSFPGSPDNHLFTNGDSHGPAFARFDRSSSQSTTNNGIPNINLTLLPKQQQQQQYFSNNGDTSNEPLDMDQQHQVYYHGEHTLGNGKDNWS